MKICIAIVAFIALWLAVDVADLLIGYHSPADMVMSSRLHDTVTYLWGAILGLSVGIVIARSRRQEAAYRCQ